jgi:peptidoglycan/LPS O-acetylase OafA/YrhL
MQTKDNQLDVLRGIAILAVLVVHVSQVSESLLDGAGFLLSSIDSTVRMISEFGKYGVELFFFLSGVLLAGRYGSGQVFSSQTFFVRRAARIVPLWYLFALASFALYWLFDLGWWKGVVQDSGGGFQGEAITAISTLLFITWALIPGTSQRTIPGGWSIEAEVAHYLLFPMLRRLSTTSLILAIAACGYLAALNDVALSELPDLNHFTMRIEALSILTTFPFFILGALVVGLSEGDVKKPGKMAATVILAFTLPGVVLLMVNEVPYGSVFEAAIFCLAAYASSTFFSGRRCLAKLLGDLGRVSYFVYFFHFFALAALYGAQDIIKESQLFQEIAKTTIALPLLQTTILVLVILASMVFGNLSMKYFEGPFLRASRRTFR